MIVTWLFTYIRICIIIHSNSTPSDLARFYTDLDIKIKSLNGEVKSEARNRLELLVYF